MDHTRVATSRIWQQTIQTGLVWAAGVVFLSVVGFVEAASQRPIIVGVVSLSSAMLLLIGCGAGAQASRRFTGAGLRLLGGAMAGAVVGLGVSLLIAIGMSVSLRVVLVSASPILFQLLSVGRGSAGIPLIVLIGVAAGMVGAAAIQLPVRWRRPILIGCGAVFTVGLFQELIRLMLQSGIRADIRDIFFTFEGLSAQGAIIIFVISAALTTLGVRYRSSVNLFIAGLPLQQRRGVRVVTVLLAMLAILALPAVGGLFISQVLVLVGLYTLMGLGLNLEVGFAGLLDLGFVAFFAIGAYTVGLLSTTSPLAIAHLSWWTAVPIAVVVSLISGVLFGLPILGIRGDYLAIATLGFGEIIRLLVLSDFLRPWFGGSQGVLGIPKPTLAGFEFAGPQQIFYLTVVSSALVAFVAARLRDSRLGRAWMAIREDEDVAEALGINTINVKLLAYGIGATFAGVSGAIFAVMLGSIFPHSFNVLISINVLALIIVGGMGSLPGVMVGSLALVGLPELLREFSDYRFLVYGAVLIVMMQFRPEGLWPTAIARRELHEAEATDLPVAEAKLASAKEPSA